MFRTDWSRIHETVGFHIHTLPLALMSLLYGIGVRARNACLKNRGQNLPGFVLSIGNITAGGTGKTPAAIMFAQWAKSQGYSAAILSRGYGGKNNEDVSVVSDGKNILMRPESCGDEPWLMATSLKDIPVVISRKRLVAGRKALENFNSNFFILDDGFQHIRLKRDMDILLADAKSPFGNGHLLPWGPLREPLSGLRRADALVFTRAGNTLPFADNPFLKNKPLFAGNHEPSEIILPNRNETLDLSYIKGKRVTAFSGIGKPESFKESLLNLGADLVFWRAFGDHYPFTRRDIEFLKKEHENLKGEILITTQKDWARIREVAKDTEYLAFLTINFVITSGMNELFDMIREKAEKVIK